MRRAGRVSYWRQEWEHSVVRVPVSVCVCGLGLFWNRTNGFYFFSCYNDSCVDGGVTQSHTDGKVNDKGCVSVVLCVYAHDQSKVRTHLVQMFCFFFNFYTADRN